jgi:DNA repair exonuclease SbcCD ATPase subunit
MDRHSNGGSWARNNINIQSEIHKIEIEIKELTDINNKLIIEKYKNEQEVTDKEEEIENYKINKIEMKDAEKEKYKYEYYKEILEKDGISMYIIKKYLDLITKGINEIIEGVIKKTIKLYEDNDKIIIEIYNNEGYIVQFVGGMETFIIDLTFKIVLSQMVEMSKSNFIFIDEGLSSLDKENIGNIEELFNFLRDYYEYIFIMSHIEGMGDNVDKEIKIIKNGLYSKILV